jgi:hypothetical protein
MGFAEVLTIVFIILKLTHAIAWSWLWVLSPLWIVYGCGLLIGVALLAGRYRFPWAK